MKGYEAGNFPYRDTSPVSRLIALDPNAVALGTIALLAILIWIMGKGKSGSGD